MTHDDQADSTRILMIDDDAKLCRLIRDYLQPVGYQVTAAYNGHDGLEAALTSSFAAIILDVMMPGLDGVELLKSLRVRSGTPVIMFTGRGEEADRIVGLELGADDYLPKTCSSRELLARLRAVLRRSWSARAQAVQHKKPVTVGALVVDAEARSVTVHGTAIHLTAAEFDILRSLAQAPGRVKTREQLLIEVADRNFEVFDRSVDVHVSSLRRKLGDDPKAPRYIITVRSVGYMLRKPESDDQA